MSTPCLAAAEQFKLHVDELDDVPLPAFGYPLNTSAAEQAEAAKEDEPLKAEDEQPLKAQAGQPQKAKIGQSLKASFDIWQKLKDEQILPQKLVEMMEKADIICSSREANLELERAQHVLGKVLDQAETVLAQVVSEHWYVTCLPECC